MTDLKLKRKKEKRSEQIIYTNDFLKSVEELNKSILLMNKWTILYTVNFGDLENQNHIQFTAEAYECSEIWISESFIYSSTFMFEIRV